MPNVNDELQDRIEITIGDITALAVDCIVNAANTTLLGGGGVDGAIHRAAGPQLVEACRGLGGCPTGQARITDGYELQSRHVIHTVGPIWQGGVAQEDRLLAACYTESFKLAQRHQIHSIAFPAISTGVYRFPKDRAAKIALEQATEQLGRNAWPQRVIFCCFSDTDALIYRQIFCDNDS